MWPPALQQHPGASLRFLFLGETDRITKWCDHQLCNSIQVRHYGSIPWRDRITKWCDHQLCNSIHKQQKATSLGRSFTSIQMFHTHAPQQRGFLVVRWKTKVNSSNYDASTMTCSIRDKAQRPSVFISTPSTAVSVQPLNYVHNWTSPETKKEKEPHLKNEPAWTEKQKMRPATAASCFNTTTTTGETLKKGQLFHFT